MKILNRVFLKNQEVGFLITIRKSMFMKIHIPGKRSKLYILIILFQFSFNVLQVKSYHFIQNLSLYSAWELAIFYNINPTSYICKTLYVLDFATFRIIIVMFKTIKQHFPSYCTKCITLSHLIHWGKRKKKRKQAVRGNLTWLESYCFYVAKLSQIQSYMMQNHCS